MLTSKPYESDAMSKNTTTLMSDEEYMVNLLIDGKWPMVSTLLQSATVIPTDIVKEKLESGVFTEDKSRALYTFLMRGGLGAERAVQDSIDTTCQLLVKKYPVLQSSSGAFASPPPFRRAMPVGGNDLSPPPFSKPAKELVQQNFSPPPFRKPEPQQAVAAPSQPLLSELPVVVAPSPWAPIGARHPVSNSWWAGVTLERSASASATSKIKPKKMKASSSDPAVAAPSPSGKPSTPPIAIAKRRLANDDSDEERQALSASSSIQDSPPHDDDWKDYVSSRETHQPGK